MKLITGTAHLIAGDASALSALLELLEQEGIKMRGNPDVYVREYARFGADDARHLREKAALRSTQGKRRIFIIAAPTMTTEAQNVLLKTLEEPPAGAVFFLVVPTPHSLLPTLRSRTQLLALPAISGEGIIDTKKFLAASADTRLEMLKPLLEKDEDDKRDLRPILSFFASLESKLQKNPESLRALYSARKYLGDKGALLKPLLEEVALLVPRVPLEAPPLTGRV